MPTVELGNRNVLKIGAVLNYATDSYHTAGVILMGCPILGLLLPALNGTPAITVEVSTDGSTWLGLKKSDGSTAAIVVTGGRLPLPWAAMN